MHSRFSQLTHLPAWLFLASFLLLSVGLASWLFSPGSGVLLPALTPQPETFTELYFEDHLKLPKKMLHETPANFTFSIHNLEGKEMTYPIELTAENQTDPPIVIPILQTERTLQPGETKTLAVEFMIPKTFGSRAKVTVLLKNLDQTIHFFVELPALPSPEPTPSPSPRPRR